MSYCLLVYVYYNKPIFKSRESLIYSRGSLGKVNKTEEEIQQSGNSLSHVKNPKEVLEFVHGQCEKYRHRTVEKPPGKIKEPRLLMLPTNWREHPILYSSNPKTGSTSMKRYFKRLQGDTRPYSEIKHVHLNEGYCHMTCLKREVSRRTGSKSPDLGEILQELDLYTVGFVRNPLVRLLSGFRDKIIRQSYEGIRDWILSRFHNNITSLSSDVDMFGGFIELLRDGTVEDDHFSPQWKNMKLCTFPYDFLGQTETTAQQIQIVQKHINAVQFEYPVSNNDSFTTGDVHKFWNSVKPGDLEWAYDYYKWDFVLTGYSRLDNPNFPYLDFDQDFSEIWGL